MAEARKNQKTNTSGESKADTAPAKPVTPPEPLNLDEKVTVRSIAGWMTGFARRADGWGDISIMPNGSIRLSRNEIIAQVQSNNKLFNGINGLGSHATLIIEDEPTRYEVGFESDGKKQEVFSDNLIKELFERNYSQTAFEEEFKKRIVTRAEKYASIEAIKRLRINDYSKIRFVEDYTGYRL